MCVCVCVYGEGVPVALGVALRPSTKYGVLLLVRARVMLTVGTMLQAMWRRTVQTYPHLAVIDDDHYVHEILQCRNEAQQDEVLRRFLEARDARAATPTSADPAVDATDSAVYATNPAAAAPAANPETNASPSVLPGPT